MIRERTEGGERRGGEKSKGNGLRDKKGTKGQSLRGGMSVRKEEQQQQDVWL